MVTHIIRKNFFSIFKPTPNILVFWAESAFEITMCNTLNGGGNKKLSYR